MMDWMWKEADLLWALWVVPVLIWIGLRSVAAQRRAAHDLVGEVMAPRLVPSLPRSAQVLRVVAFAAGVALTVVALARPAWDYEYVKTDARGVDVVIALDVSRSMLALDGDESRLDRARSALNELVERLRGDRVALLLFAGEQVLTCPLTYDRGFLRQALREASPSVAGRGGTLLRPALEKALSVLDASVGRDKVCVLVTDAGDQESLPSTVAAELVAKKIRVLAVGVGRTGANPEEPLVVDGQVVRNREGRAVLARVDEDLLRRLVERTHGVYVPPARTFELADVYEDYVAPLEKGEVQETRERHWRDRYQWFLLPAVMCFLYGVGGWTMRGPRRVTALAALVLSLGACGGSDPLDRAREALLQEDAAAALTALEEALEDRPDDPVILYDLGCAYQGASRREEARDRYAQVLSLGPRPVRARSLVNLVGLEMPTLRDLAGDSPSGATPTVRDDIRRLADAMLDRLQQARTLDPDLTEAAEQQDQLARWLALLEDDWAAKDRSDLRGKRQGQRGAAFVRALYDAQRQVLGGLVESAPLHHLALDQRDLRDDLDLVPSKFEDKAPELDEGQREAVTSAIATARVAMTQVEGWLADGRLDLVATGGDRALLSLVTAYAAWAEPDRALGMVATVQREIGESLRGYLQGPHAGSDPNFLDRAGMTLDGQRRALEQAAPRFLSQGPDVLDPAAGEFARDALDRTRRALEDAFHELGNDVTGATDDVVRAGGYLARIMEDWRVSRLPAGKAARSLERTVKGLRVALEGPDALALAASSTGDAKTQVSDAHRRVGFLRAQIQKTLGADMGDSPTAEQTEAFQARVARLESIRGESEAALQDARRHLDEPTWPPPPELGVSLGTSRAALRTLWSELSSLEDELGFAIEDQGAQVGRGEQALARITGEGPLSPELDFPPLSPLAQQREQDLVADHVEHLVQRLPGESAVQSAQAGGNGSETATPNQLEAGQMVAALEAVGPLLEQAARAATKAATALTPPTQPTDQGAYGSILGAALPEEKGALSALQSALAELRSARAPLPQMAGEIMKAELEHLPVARDLVAGWPPDGPAGIASRAEELAAQRARTVGSWVPRLPSGVERMMAEIRQQSAQQPGQPGAPEPDPEHLAQQQQALELVVTQLTEAYERGQADLAEEPLDRVSRDIHDVIVAARDLWASGTDLRGMLEHGVAEQSGLMDRTGALEAATDPAPPHRRTGLAEDQERLRTLVPALTARLEASSDPNAQGGLPEEVVDTAQTNLPLVDQAMGDARDRLVQGTWDTARAAQARAKQLLEEILEKFPKEDPSEEPQPSPEPDASPEQTDEERQRQQNAVEERSQKMRDRQQQKRDRTPVAEDW